MSVIYLVDDLVIMLMSMEMLLKWVGYMVIKLESVEVVMIVFELISFKLIIIDLNMLGMNGIEFIKMLK